MHKSKKGSTHFKIRIYLYNMKELQREREKDEQRELPPAVSLFRWSQQPHLCWSEPGSRNFFQVFHTDGRAQGTGSSSIAFPDHLHSHGSERGAGRTRTLRPYGMLVLLVQDQYTLSLYQHRNIHFETDFEIEDLKQIELIQILIKDYGVGMSSENSMG